LNAFSLCILQKVDGGGNASKAGLKAGDQVIYTSSFFGDELWPADKLGLTKTAINAKPDSVYFVVARCSTSLYTNMNHTPTSVVKGGVEVSLFCFYDLAVDRAGMHASKTGMYPNAFLRNVWKENHTFSCI